VPGVADPTAPDEALEGYLTLLLDADHRARVGSIGMLRLIDPTRTALRAYERQLVALARSEGRTWEEIGEALSVTRQEAHRRWKHVG
jgi:hypothetical protein